MRRGQPKSSFQNGPPRYPRDPREKSLHDEFISALADAEKNSRSLTEVFAKYVALYESNKFSIRDLIKIGLGERYKARLENCDRSAATQQLIRLILDDLSKERNQNSNASIFFKFVGVNNLASLPPADALRVLRVCLAKINAYISCDKNIFYLLLKLLKSHPIAITSEYRHAVFSRLFDSFLLYFVEFENEKLRKDNEVIKNFISHYKLFNFLKDVRFFENIETFLQDAVIQIALCTFFIGSSMERHVFQSLKELTQALRERLHPRSNTFYFEKGSGRAPARSLTRAL